jgi:hypothetical protein
MANDKTHPIFRQILNGIVQRPAIVDVCLAGAPAINGVCGDPECVCARPTKEAADGK